MEATPPARGTSRRQRRGRVAGGFAVVLVALLATTILGQRTTSSARAQGTGAEFSLDLDPTGNTVAAIGGKIERCRGDDSTVTERTVEFDVVLEAGPPELAVIKYLITYPIDKLQLVGKTVLVEGLDDQSDLLPDSDGSYLTALLKPTPPGVAFSGSGAVVRYQFRLKEEGFAPLALSNFTLMRYQGGSLELVEVNSAHVGVNARVATNRACAVIVIPGIMGSKLEDRAIAKPVWAPTTFAGIPEFLANVGRIKLAADGKSPDPSIQPGPPDIVATGVWSYYEELGTYLVDKLGFTKAALQFDPKKDECKLTPQPDATKLKPDLFLFPYDWRRDNRESAHALGVCVEQIKKETTVDNKIVHKKFTVIPHSMGGLVTRYYATKLAGASQIDRVIFLGTPQLGSVDIYVALRLGLAVKEQKTIATLLTIAIPSQKAKWLSDTVAAAVKDLVRNLPSAYQLLPTEAYFNALGPIARANGKVLRTPAATYNDKLAGVSNVPLWQSMAVPFWSDINAWRALGTLDTDIFLLRGVRLGTLDFITFQQVNLQGMVGGGLKLMVSGTLASGDERVHANSAGGVLAAPGKVRVPVDVKVVHGLMPSDGTIQENVAQIIRRKYQFAGQVSPFGSIDGIELSYTSDPVRLEIFDPRGRRIGPVRGGHGVGIDGAVYARTIDGSELVFLPPRKRFRIRLTGIGKRNKFFLIVKRTSGRRVKTAFYEGTMVRGGKADAAFNSARPTLPTMRLDSDNNGRFESRVKPQKRFKPKPVRKRKASKRR